MKHSVIIGGTKGVGRHLSSQMANSGQVVTAVGRTPGTFPEVTGSGRIEALAADVEQSTTLVELIGKAIKKNGPISSLVFLQRYRGKGDTWTGEIEVSMNATKLIIETFVDDFAKDGDRSICIVTSNATSFIARNQTLAYHMSKAALKQMARYYAVHYGPKGIRVNIVSPCTFVKDESAQFYSTQTELNEMYKTVVPLGRMGTAKEVSDAILFLCGPTSTFITGQEILVDGGLSLMLQDSLAKEVKGI